MEYKIPIVKTKIKQKQVTSMHLIAGFMNILIAATTWVIINTIVQTTLMDTLNYLSYFYFSAGILIIMYTILNNKKLRKLNTNIALRIIEILLFTFIIIYSLLNNWYMTAVYGLVGVIAILITLINEINASKPVYITINEQGVYFPYKVKKQITWPNIKNLILKHGNFTINTRDNVHIQHPLNKNEDIQLESIENYALIQINNNEHLYKADW